jgi:hypothetical protein
MGSHPIEQNLVLYILNKAQFNDILLHDMKISDKNVKSLLTINYNYIVIFIPNIKIT